MLNFPSSLFRSFKSLSKARLTRNNHTDVTSLQQFQQLLNDAQPKSLEELVLYKFIHGMFLEGRSKFLNYIRHTKMECLVLWTDARSIIRAFELRSIVYIKWVDDTRTYEVDVYKAPTSTESTRIPQSIKRIDDHPTMKFLANSFTELDIEAEPTTPKKILTSPKSSAEPVSAPTPSVDNSPNAKPIDVNPIRGKWGDLNDDSDPNDETSAT